MKKLKALRKAILESEFWLPVSVNVVSGVILSACLYGAAHIPAVWNFLAKRVIETKTNIYSSKVAIDLAQNYLEEGEPLKAFALSKDIVRTSSDINTVAAASKIGWMANAKIDFDLKKKIQDDDTIIVT